MRKQHKTPQGTHFEFASFPISKSGFALRMRDDSMAPDVPEGVIVFIDPEVPPESGSFVLAFTDDRSLPTIKEYVIDGNIEYLKPRNQRYDQVRFTGGAAKIVGVVVEMRKVLHPPSRR